MKPANRLIALDDAVQGQNSLGDFHDNGLCYGKHGLDEFYYDANGNMVGDMNRNMKLKYGLFHNMPIFIHFADVGGGGGGGTIEQKPSDDVRHATTTSYSGSIVNHYSYQGRKLGKKVYNSQHTLTVDEAYYDELMLSFGVPARISHGDGYVVLDKHGAVDGFYFYLKDHLGNVRSVITPGQNNQPEVVQANDYYPFGMSLSTAPGANKFMYNSKEEQEMPGKWLDYGARFYDAQIGRWHSVDPLAEERSWLTPYNYVQNNPLEQGVLF